MKKRIALLLAGVLAVTSLVACGGNAGGNDAAKVKVGLGACTSFSESYSIGEDHYGQPATATNAQVDIHVAAVTLADGKIASIQIDAIQVKNSVDATGALAADAKTEFTSKNDLKDDYAMKPASPIGMEWFTQVDNFENWATGKTLDEVKAGIGADGYPSDATTADTLGLALIGEMTNVKAPADNDGKGTFQAYVNFACTTQNANGEITAVLIDSIQASPSWDATGKLTTDLDQDVRTKYTKKDDYGMQPASSLENGEWFEQIDVFKQSILGKKAADVTAIAVDEKGYPTDDTLRTGCTMKVSAYKTVVVKSLEK